MVEKNITVTLVRYSGIQICMLWKHGYVLTVGPNDKVSQLVTLRNNNRYRDR